MDRRNRAGNRLHNLKPRHLEKISGDHPVRFRPRESTNQQASAAFLAALAEQRSTLSQESAALKLEPTTKPTTVSLVHAAVRRPFPKGPDGASSRWAATVPHLLSLLHKRSLLGACSMPSFSASALRRSCTQLEPTAHPRQGRQEQDFTPLLQASYAMSGGRNGTVHAVVSRLGIHYVDTHTKTEAFAGRLFDFSERDRLTNGQLMLFPTTELEGMLEFDEEDEELGGSRITLRGTNIAARIVGTCGNALVYGYVRLRRTERPLQFAPILSCETYVPRPRDCEQPLFITWLREGHKMIDDDAGKSGLPRVQAVRILVAGGFDHNKHDAGLYEFHTGSCHSCKKATALSSVSGIGTIVVGRQVLESERFDQDEGVYVPTISSAPAFLLGARNGRVLLWDTRSPTATTLAALPCCLADIQSVRGGGWLTADIDTHATISDPRMWGRPLCALLNYSNKPSRRPVAVSSDGHLAAAACKDGVVRVWETRLGREVAVHSPCKPVPGQDASSTHYRSVVLSTGINGQPEIWAESEAGVVRSSVVDIVES